MREPLRSGQRAMAVLLVLSLMAAVLVPIYTDEVAWRIQLSRFVQDGWIDHAVGETCGANTVAVPPFFMLPVRLFSSAATWATTVPAAVRVIGIVNALFAAAMLNAIIGTIARDRSHADRMRLATWSLLGLGTMPYLLVVSRPEQPLLLSILGALLFLLPAPSLSPRAFYLRLGGIISMAAVALSYHLKTVFYLPVFAAALIILPATAGRRSRATRAAALAVLAALGLVAARYWSHRFACPDDPRLAAKLAGENVSVLLLNGGWPGVGAAIPRLFANVLPTSYILNATPVPRTMSDWLPMLPVGLPVLSPWIGLCAIGWLVTIAAVLTFARGAIVDRTCDTSRAVTGSMLFACATGWSAFQIHKNSYESALYLPVVLLAALLLWSARREDHRWTGPVCIGLAVISAISQLLLLTAYGPMLWHSRRDSYPAAQRYSIGSFGYDRDAVVAAGRRCGLEPEAGPRRVLVDDLTYFTYARTAWPLYRLGVLDVWSGSTGDPYRWLHAHGSPGAVLACAYLPPAMRRHAIATGPICCVDTR